MEVIGLSLVCREAYHFDEFNDTKYFEALKLVGAIEWERKVGYKPTFSIEKLVSHMFYI